MIVRSNDGVLSMKVMILCGGQGTRLREHTEVRPKPMVEIGGRPILWHIMNLYAFHGFQDFILCLGYKAQVIKEYFLNYRAMTSDFTVQLGATDGICWHSDNASVEQWRVTLADTGEETMTGARICRAAKYLDPHDESFMVTYGDGLSDVNLLALLDFHRNHGKLATVTGVHPPSRFGELECDGDKVRAFGEKPQTGQGLINGGFFCFRRRFLEYLSGSPDCVLERGPLESCTADGELRVYRHSGYWQCMDTYRDWLSFEQQWQSGSAPWKLSAPGIAASGEESRVLRPGGAAPLARGRRRASA
jgi:glucose-1-phosphate cytidylyltransferase